MRLRTTTTTTASTQAAWTTAFEKLYIESVKKRTSRRPTVAKIEAVRLHRAVEGDRGRTEGPEEER